jgi:hypothetical protein
MSISGGRPGLDGATENQQRLFNQQSVHPSKTSLDNKKAGANIAACFLL